MTNSPKDPQDGEAVTPTGHQGTPPDVDEPVTVAVHVDAVAKDAATVAFARLLRDGTIQYDVYDPTHPDDWAHQESFFRHMGEQLVPPLRPRLVTHSVIHTAEEHIAEGWRKAADYMLSGLVIGAIPRRRPKRSDISDEQVIQAAIDVKKSTNHFGGIAIPTTNTCALLRERTGHPRKVVLAAILRAQGHGYVESGVSVETSWATPEGLHFLATKDLRDRISELEKKLREARKTAPPVEPEHPGELSPEQHYDLAETTLAATGGFPYGSDELGDMLAEAQVHATLATYRRVEK